MTGKRFKLHIIWYNKEKTEGKAELTDNGQLLLITDDIVGARLIKDCLNELIEENEQLKTQLQNTSDQRDEFHRGARENANRVGKLKKENEQLVKMLNNAANYVQREHREIPLDDFVEWWNNMVTEGLDD